MGDTLLKRWNNWEDGIGYVIDDGERNGLYKASGLLGLRGELRVAPFKNTVTVDFDAADHYQYFFEESSPNSSVTSAGGNNSSWNNGGAQTATISLNVGTGENRILLVWVCSNTATGTPAITATYAGVSMELHGPWENGNMQLRIFFLAAPTSGTNDLVVTNTSGTCDAVVLTWAMSTASQATPQRFAASGSGTAIAVSGIDSSVNELMFSAAFRAADTTITKAAAQVSLLANKKNTDLDITASLSYEVGSASAGMEYTAGASGAWIIAGVAVAGATPGPSYLYGMRGGRVGNTPAKMEKVFLANEAFAALATGTHTLTNLYKCGQPTRYQGFWWIPDGDEFDPRKLTVALGNVSADTLVASSAWASGGADHLGNMGGQMIAALKDNGFAILKVDGTPTTTVDWGSYFQAGDKNERAAAIAGSKGLSFVLTREGLFSFTKTGRSGLVFEDFRSWRNAFDNIPMAPWRGGFVFPGPTGELLFYAPGELPVNIGIKSRGLSPLGVTEPSGRYMGVHATGDYIWAVYQPNLSSTSVDIQCGYPRAEDPRDLIWQTVATSTLNDAQHLLGCFVSAQSQPLSSTYYTPCVWFGDGNDLAYLVLDPRAGPFRARGDTHKVRTAGDAHLSEIEFAEPQDLTRIVVYTGSDRVAGDEWQVSLIADGVNADKDVGAPIRSNAIRHERLINRHSVQRVMLHVTFAGTSAAARVPPAIKRIDLFGNPSVGA